MLPYSIKENKFCEPIEISIAPAKYKEIHRDTIYRDSIVCNRAVEHLTILCSRLVGRGAQPPLGPCRAASKRAIFHCNLGPQLFTQPYWPYMVINIK